MSDFLSTFPQTLDLFSVSNFAKKSIFLAPNLGEVRSSSFATATVSVQAAQAYTALQCWQTCIKLVCFTFMVSQTKQARS